MTRDELLGQIESAALELGELVGDTHAPMLGQRILEAVRKLKDSPPIDPDAQAREAEIKARENAATPGPWVADLMENIYPYLEGKQVGKQWGCSWPEKMCMRGTEADAKFKAHARSDIPWLLSQTAALRARVAELEAREGK